MAGIGKLVGRPKLRGMSVDGEWSMFSPDSGTLGVPRDAMPQIATEARGAMVRFLNARGVPHNEEVVDAAVLKPTQAEFSEAKVKKARNFTGGNRAILVSNDNHILDGHHQWMAAHDGGEDIRVIRLGASIGNLINTLRDMPSATTTTGEPSPLVVAPTPPPSPYGLGAMVKPAAGSQQNERKR